MAFMEQLKEVPEAKSAIGAMLRQIGWRKLAVSGMRAAARSRLNREQLRRQFIVAFWETLGNREAIITDDRRVTFAQFRSRTLRLADALYGLGVKPGEAVAELLYNGAPWFETMAACTLMGYPMPMLNWHLRPQELADCINRAEPKVLVFDSEFLEGINSIRAQLKTVEHFVLVGATRPGVLSYEDLIASSTERLPPGNLDMAPRAYSGGTTGTPRYINIDRERMASTNDDDRRGASKAELVRLALMQLSALHWYKIGDIRDRITHNVRSLIPGPLYHAGVQIGVLPFFFGGTVVPMRKFTPEGFLEAIQDERINWTFVAPTMLERVLSLPDSVKEKYDLSSMRSLICAAAPCPPKVKREINALFRQQGNPGDVFMEYYGASETGMISVLVPEDYQADPKRYESVGKLRAAECKIYDEASHSWCPPGKEGKVLVRTPMTFALQYVGLDEETMRKSYIEIDGKLWYDDGLIGYLCDDGYLYLTSRIKEMIISGGVNIFPNEIEDVIKRHSKVLDAAVVRAPDTDLGEVPVAVVQLKDGEQSSASEIIAHCKQEGLYGFKLPKMVDFVEQLPRNLAGKLPKKQLEEQYWRGLERHG